MYYISKINEDDTFEVSSTSTQVPPVQVTKQGLEVMQKAHPVFDTSKSRAYSSLKELCDYIVTRCRLLNKELKLEVTELFNTCKIRIVSSEYTDRAVYSVPNGITTIDEGAMCGISGEVVLPDTVDDINFGAFADATLTSINVPKFVKLLSNAVFSECKSLKSVVFDGDNLLSIGSSCFIDCSVLESLSIPDSVTHIGNNCFKNCWALKEIKLPSSLNELGESCFVECIALETIKLPDNLEVLRPNTFAYCRKLKTVEFGKHLNVVDYNCFIECDSLEYLRFPEGLSMIGSGVFSQRCTALREIIFPRSVFQIGDNTDLKYAPNLVCKVYKSSYAEGWCKKQGLKYMYID